ncbi:MAG: hypothetical protein JNL32_00215 [Candidatus Kapabacteria bacterium]|nr:hypothetical protein [Candidatus Kapabacteria bacterium]
MIKLLRKILVGAVASQAETITITGNNPFLIESGSVLISDDNGVKDAADAQDEVIAQITIGKVNIVDDVNSDITGYIPLQLLRQVLESESFKGIVVQPGDDIKYIFKRDAAISPQLVGNVRVTVALQGRYI